jgi:nitrogen fixation-related uncharacterized protein
MTFLDVWIGYAIFGVSIFSVVFIWAVRNRQFSDMDRVRFFALKAAQPVENESDNPVPSRLDRYTWVGLFLITLGVVVSGLWVGYGHK